MKPNPSANRAAEMKLARIDQLVSALVDEVITDLEIRELSSLLEESPEARGRYIESIRMHVDLMDHFHPIPPFVPGQTASPVLGFLGAANSTDMPLAGAN